MLAHYNVCPTLTLLNKSNVPTNNIVPTAVFFTGAGVPTSQVTVIEGQLLSLAPPLPSATTASLPNLHHPTHVAIPSNTGTLVSKTFTGNTTTPVGATTVSHMAVPIGSQSISLCVPYNSLSRHALYPSALIRD